MKQCPNCQFENPYTATHCSNCGLLLGTTTLLTNPVTRKTGLLTPMSTGEMHDDLRDIIQSATKETVTIESTEYLRFEIAGAELPLIVPIRRELILGRRDPNSRVQPDVNLTPYSGYRMGVSRHHALITRDQDGQLAIADLGSSNGTYLNERKLEVRRPYPLKSGDEISLGQMLIFVHVHQSDTA